jgi:sugar (pentulose or hexulose) kinase
MNATFLTFDLGTTALKTALISQEGKPLAVYTREYTPRAPQPDWLEMIPEDYWQAAAEGTRAVLKQTGLAPSRLKGIGFSSQGQTFVPIDRAGRALYNAIVWVDNRAQKIADEWQSSWLTREKFHRSSGYPWIPAVLTVFKIGWLARHAPQAHRAWKFLCLPDYLLFRLTGETATDYITARMSGLFDLELGDWGSRLLESAGITREQLPVVLSPGAVAGMLHKQAAAELGLPSGIPVSVGANDQIAGAVGAGNVHPGIVTETTGTALALVATTPELLNDRRVIVGRHALPEFSYAMTLANTSAIVLKWFRDLCAPDQEYIEFLKGVEAIPCGCDGLTVLPHFMGMNMPSFDPRVRGAFVGLTLGHTRAHLARAIMESCACLLEECLAPIRERGLSIRSVRSLGGAAHNDYWLQMKADLIGSVVERPACADAASLGAAVLAATGIGEFSSITEASEAWYRPERLFEPNPARHIVYREVYRRYQDLMQRIYGDAASPVFSSGTTS